MGHKLGSSRKALTSSLVPKESTTNIGYDQKPTQNVV